MGILYATVKICPILLILGWFFFDVSFWYLRFFALMIFVYMLFKNFLLLYCFVRAPCQNLNYWLSLNYFLYFVSLSASDIVAGDKHIFLIILTYVGLQNSTWMWNMVTLPLSVLLKIFYWFLYLLCNMYNSVCVKPS